MKYTTDEKTRLAIDDLLRTNASLEAKLGQDSSKEEYYKTRKEQDKLYLQIKELDDEFYQIIVTPENR